MNLFLRTHMQRAFFFTAYALLALTLFRTSIPNWPLILVLLLSAFLFNIPIYQSIQSYFRSRPWEDAVASAIFLFAYLIWGSALLLAPHLERSPLEYLQLPAFFLSIAAFSFSQALEQTLKKKANAFFATRKSILPAKAIAFIDNDLQSEIDCEKILPGQIIKITSGDIVPTDGTITWGSGFFEEGLLHQDYKSLAKGTGSWIYAGSKLQHGTVLFRSHATQKNSAIFLLEEAALQGQKDLRLLVNNFQAKYRKFAILFFVFLSFGACYYWYGKNNSLAFASFLSPLLFLGPWGLKQSALFVQQSGIRAAALSGIIINNPSSLRQLATVDTIVFGRRGLLTEGKATLSETHTLKFSEDRALQIAASLALHSDHELAYALLQDLRSRGIPFESSNHILKVENGGVSGSLDGEIYHLGTLRWFKQKKYDLSMHEALLKKEYSFLLLADKNKIIAIFCFEENLKKSTQAALKIFKSLGIHSILATGENKSIGELTGKELEVEHVYAELNLQDKKNLLEKLALEGLQCAYVAAPDSELFSEAKVGISYKAVAPKGAIAVSLLQADLLALAQAILLAKQSKRESRRSFWIGQLLPHILWPLTLGIFPFWLNPWALSIVLSVFSCLMLLWAYRHEYLPAK